MYNMYIVHSRKLAWTPEIPVGERKSLFQTMILRVHLGFQECGIFWRYHFFGLSSAIVDPAQDGLWQPEVHWLLFVPWYKGLGHFVNPKSIGKSRTALTFVCFNHFACQTFLFYKFDFLNRGWRVFIVFPRARETCVDSKAPAAQYLKLREVVCGILSSFILSTAGAVQVLFLSSCFFF